MIDNDYSWLEMILNDLKWLDIYLKLHFLNEKYIFQKFETFIFQVVLILDIFYKVIPGQFKYLSFKP